MKGMIQKKCAKCSGTLVIECDHRGWYAVCLHCGKESFLKASEASSRVGLSRSASHA